jgi:hypothetical protein
MISHGRRAPVDLRLAQTRNRVSTDQTGAHFGTRRLELSQFSVISSANQTDINHSALELVRSA